MAMPRSQLLLEEADQRASSDYHSGSVYVASAPGARAPLVHVRTPRRDGGGRAPRLRGPLGTPGIVWTPRVDRAPLKLFGHAKREAIAARIFRDYFGTLKFLKATRSCFLAQDAG
ncbi:hypothetical protein NDU88_000627 [Pleurodeles waltl]|uniref:Uncharacterized protein n=1 Tax=Pleurodeles waltl TaxID=8319 RepID=A0AAV7MHF0_PLEWA|nr:hypothetical protein NDU88_000627 [Pleurodeles waltl]